MPQLFMQQTSHILLRSHFEGQNLMQGGGLSPFSQTTGWLGRALDLAKLPGRSLSLDMPLLSKGN